jgi:predicted nucleic acid-binding protein
MNICVDTGFLIGLYSEKNPSRHSKAESIFVQYFKNEFQNKLLVPWPILYEAVTTKITKNQKRMETLNRDWKTLHRQGRLELLDDTPFREKAIDESFEETKRDPLNYRGLSLTDRAVSPKEC